MHNMEEPYTRNIMSVLHLLLRTDPPKIGETKTIEFDDDWARKVTFRAHYLVLKKMLQDHSASTVYDGTRWIFYITQNTGADQ